jgi:ABC transporter substrate binding protein
VIGGSLMLANGKRIAGFALKSRLPSMYNRRESVDVGGLMSYGADLANSYRVAYYVDRILKGAKPADLPVEQPTKFELAFNLKTAKQIGVTIPQSMLYRADKVITTETTARPWVSRRLKPAGYTPSHRTSPSWGLAKHREHPLTHQDKGSPLVLALAKSVRETSSHCSSS